MRAVVEAKRVVGAKGKARVEHNESHLLTVRADLELLGVVVVRHLPIAVVARELQKSLLSVVAVVVSSDYVDGQLVDGIPGFEGSEHSLEFAVDWSRLVGLGGIEVIAHGDEGVDVIG